MRHILVRSVVALIPLFTFCLLTGCGEKRAIRAPAAKLAAESDEGFRSASGDYGGGGLAGGGRDVSTLQDRHYHNDSAKTTQLRNDQWDGRASTLTAAGGGEEAGGADRRKAALPRKLTYNADVQVIVPDLDEAKTKLHQAMKDHKALLTHEDASGAEGSQRTGRWTFRVPTEKFDAFLAAVGQLGHVERTTTKTQDVTEEFYDLKGRISQKEIEAKGLEKLQEEAVAIMNKDPKARMEDVLAVRREWNSVRQELDRMQGRLKLLENLTELTTVTVSATERKNYVPPSAPTFGNRITSTFGDSTDALMRFGEGLVLVGVGLAPWLPVIVIVVVPCWLLVRRALRRTPAVVPTALPAGPANE